MPLQSYVICTSPRSGSTLLCRLLSGTGIAGNPESYFHSPSLDTWMDSYGITRTPSESERELLASVFKAAICEGRSDGDVFGLRLQRHSFDFFCQKLAVLYPELTNDAQRLTAAFGQTSFIHLTRNNKLEQAISYVKAEQSGLWHMSSDGTELERLSPPQIPSYDAKRIQNQLEQFNAYDRDWHTWFDCEKITPLQITYEELSSEPANTVRKILQHLGLDPNAADDLKPDVKKLADVVNSQWVVRFSNETNVAQ